MPVVLFLDLDDFKVVNDTLGHAAGDRLLADVAARLRTVLRAEDVAARLGGDEFAVLLDDDPGLSESEAVAAADHRSACARAFSVDGHETTVGASIGIAAARLGTERADELLRNADVAMYTAKASGKNRVSVVRADHARRDRRAPRAQRRALAEPRPGRARRLLPADRRAVRRRGHRHGGARPLAPPRPRPDRTRASSSTSPKRTGMILPLGRWVLVGSLPSGRRMVQARADAVSR